MDTTRVVGQQNQYNAVFTDKKDNSQMEQMDFIKLMVAQMQNQDFNNPMDDSQMVTQMAQFSNMQQMQEMASYAKTNYAMSIVGKTVTASRFGVSGNLDTTTGMVQKVSLVDDEYVIYVGGKKYTLEQIMSVQDGVDKDKSVIDTTGYSLTASEVKSNSAVIGWKIPTEDELTKSSLKYTVYYSKDDTEFNTVEKVEQGTKANWSSLPDQTSVNLTDLEANTTYYANVVITDDNGAKTVYKPVAFKTLRS